MARIYYLADDTLRIDRGFDTEGYGIFVNNRLAYEGPLPEGEGVSFSVGKTRLFGQAASRR